MRRPDLKILLATTLFATLALGALAGRAHAAAPVITSTFPAHIVVDDPGTPHQVTVAIFGKNLNLPTTNSSNFLTDVGIYANAGVTDTWHRAANVDPWLVNTSGVTPTEVDVRINGVSQVGAITIAVCVRTTGCAYTLLPVLRREQASVEPTPVRIAQVPATVPAGDASRFTYVQATGMDDTTRLAVGGVWATYYNFDPNADSGDYYVPSSIQAATGTYLVTMASEAGPSLTSGHLEVWSAPVFTGTAPTLSAFPASVPLTFRDRFGVPDRMSAVWSVPNCSDQTVTLTSTSDHTFNVTLPGGCANATSSYVGTLKVTNFVGTTGISVVVHPGALKGPGSGIQL